MKKYQIEQFVLGVVAALTVVSAHAWTKATEADAQTPVRVIQKTDYVKAEKVDSATVSAAAIQLNGGVKGSATCNTSNVRYLKGCPVFPHIGVNAQGSFVGKEGARTVSATSVESHQYTDLYLDTDGDMRTAEGIATICTDCPDVKMNMFAVTNGFQTSIQGVKKLAAHDCENKHAVEVFLRSSQHENQ